LRRRERKADRWQLGEQRLGRLRVNRLQTGRIISQRHKHCILNQSKIATVDVNFSAVIFSWHQTQSQKSNALKGLNRMEHLFGSEEFPCFTLGCACHMSNFSVTLSQNPSTVRQTRNGVAGAIGERPYLDCLAHLPMAPRSHGFIWAASLSFRTTV